MMPHNTSYAILDDDRALGGQAIRCLRCGATRYTPTDVQERYCAQCHTFHDPTKELIMPETPNPDALRDLREALAALAHSQWAGWMGYLFSRARLHDDGTATIPAWAVERWQRQCATPYAGLPPEEQASDQAEAARVIAVVAAWSRRRGGVQRRERDLAELVAILAVQRIGALGACPLCDAPVDAQATVTHAPGCPIEAYMLAR